MSVLDGFTALTVIPRGPRSRLAAFVSQLDEGAAPEDIDGSGEDGLAAQEVLAAAIESIENETVVRLEPSPVRTVRGGTTSCGSGRLHGLDDKLGRGGSSHGCHEPGLGQGARP